MPLPTLEGAQLAEIENKFALVMTALKSRVWQKRGSDYDRECQRRAVRETLRDAVDCVIEFDSSL